MRHFTWQEVYQIQRKSKCPSKRWGHQCCVIGDSLILFGGYSNNKYLNDLWEYDPHTFNWTQLETTGYMPTVRSNFTLHYLPQTNELILFGGGASKKERFNTVHRLNWLTKEWNVVVPKNNQPVPEERTYHSSEIIYPYLFVFGGEGVVSLTLDDLWAFNLETSKWTQINAKKKPTERRFHSSVLVGHEMLIIGGCNAQYKTFRSAHSIDLGPLIKKGKEGQCPTLKWQERYFSQPELLSRWGHSSSFYGGCVYIFGGRSTKDWNDLLILDLYSMEIKQLQTGNLAARRRHSSAIMGSTLIIHGGFNGSYLGDFFYANLLDLDDLKSQSHYNRNIIQMSDGEMQTLLIGKRKESHLSDCIVHLIGQGQEKLQLNFNCGRQKLQEKSQYFKKHQLFTGVKRLGKGQLEEIVVRVPFKVGRLHELFFNYLISGLLVIPTGFQLEQWMELIEIADYFLAISAVQLFTKELMLKINATNHTRVIDFALDLNLTSLLRKCIQCSYLNNQNQFISRKSLASTTVSINDTCESRSSQSIVNERMTKEMNFVYESVRFQIIQKSRMKIESEKHLKKDDSFFGRIVRACTCSIRVI